MSSVQSIGGNDSTNLAALLQEIMKQRETNRGTQTSSAGTAQTGSGNDQGVEGLQSKIDDAISKALQGLDKSSSASTVMDTIKQAVDSTLEANGISPQSRMGGMPPPPPQDGSGQSGMGGVGGTRDGFQEKIDQLLKENGFDPDKIRSELESERQSMQVQQGQSTIFDFLKALENQQGVDVKA